MDVFSLFHNAHLVYIRLQQDDPNVDVSLPVLEKGGEGYLNVRMSKGIPTEDKRLNGTTPCKVFQQQPQEIKGSFSVITQRLQNYIGVVVGLPVTLYQQYGRAIQKTLLTSNIIDKVVAVLGKILSRYPGTHAVPEEFEIKIKFVPPAKIIVFSQSCGAAMVYNFQSQVLTLSGFKDPTLVKYDDCIDSIGFPISSVEVREGLISESTEVILNLESVAILTERIDLYQQTTDDMLDHIIQKLVLLDVLDAVQDIIIGDDGEIYLCFDPVLERDEIDAIVMVVKEVYPQTLLVDTPESAECQWWVIEIAKVSETATQVSNAGVTSEEERTPEGIIAKDADDSISVLAKEIDVDAAITSASEG